MHFQWSSFLGVFLERAVSSGSASRFIHQRRRRRRHKTRLPPFVTDFFGKDETRNRLCLSLLSSSARPKRTKPAPAAASMTRRRRLYATEVCRKKDKVSRNDPPAAEPKALLDSTASFSEHKVRMISERNSNFRLETSRFEHLLMIAEFSVH